MLHIRTSIVSTAIAMTLKMKASICHLTTIVNNSKYLKKRDCIYAFQAIPCINQFLEYYISVNYKCHAMLEILKT
jgi:hypothetical protein